MVEILLFEKELPSAPLFVSYCSETVGVDSNEEVLSSIGLQSEYPSGVAAFVNDSVLGGIAPNNIYTHCGTHENVVFCLLAFRSDHSL